MDKGVRVSLDTHSPRVLGDRTVLTTLLSPWSGWGDAQPLARA